MAVSERLVTIEEFEAFIAQPENSEVHTPEDLQVLTLNDTLDGGDVLPGFMMPVKDIFDV
jgi:hypothetical protein